MASALEDKIVQALQANPALEHGTFADTLEHRERQYLLQTVRDMENRGLLRRDLSLKRDGKAVLRYLRGTG